MTLPPKNPTVLCVDDAESILRFYEELFVRHGYDVVAAANGYQALAAFRAHESRIDAVVLDYEMPGMTGLELAILLKKHNPDLPIMMISGIEPEWEEISPFIDVAIAKGVPIGDIILNIELLLAERPLRQVRRPC